MSKAVDIAFRIDQLIDAKINGDRNDAERAYARLVDALKDSEYEIRRQLERI